MKLECASAGRTADKGRVFFFFFYCENLVLWFLHDEVGPWGPQLSTSSQSALLLLLSVTSAASDVSH